MTDWLEKLKSVAAGRTGGQWRFHNKNALNEWNVYGPDRQLYFSDGITKCASDAPKPYPLEHTEGNAKFIATAANCFDELLAVVEAAWNKDEVTVISRDETIWSHEDIQLNKALAALAAKVEGSRV